MLNIHRPRDRSHYEQFKHFHQTFYRSVEAASVTPFAARALDRGLAGVLVALARPGTAAMTPATGAGQIRSHRAKLEALARNTFAERIDSQPHHFGSDTESAELRRSVGNRMEDLLDAWCGVLADAQKSGQQLGYQKYEPGSAGQRHLLRDRMAGETTENFEASRSLRDVEPDIRLDLVKS